MNEDQKKILTEEVLGEFWHECIYGEIIPDHDFKTMARFSCSCGGDDVTEGHFNYNRSFTTDKDFCDLYRKLQELGLWLEFTDYAHNIWYHDDSLELPHNADAISWYTQWLISPDRCQTVAEFWERRKEKR